MSHKDRQWVIKDRQWVIRSMNVISWLITRCHSLLEDESMWRYPYLTADPWLLGSNVFFILWQSYCCTVNRTKSYITTPLQSDKRSRLSLKKKKYIRTKNSVGEFFVLPKQPNKSQTSYTPRRRRMTGYTHELWTNDVEYDKKTHDYTWLHMITPLNSE
jgi:hypothetical protein